MGSDAGTGDRRAGAAAAKTRDFIATLHVLAAGEASKERIEQAVRETFARFVKEARAADLASQNLAQAWVIVLHDTLIAALTLPHSERFEMVRSIAHELTIEWLRDN